MQKLNDANGIGTPGRKIRTKTQKTKNQLKNLLTPRTVKTSKREIPALGDEKKGWHANSYNVAQVIKTVKQVVLAWTKTTNVFRTFQFINDFISGCYLWTKAAHFCDDVLQEEVVRGQTGKNF